MALFRKIYIKNEDVNENWSNERIKVRSSGVVFAGFLNDNNEVVQFAYTHTQRESMCIIYSCDEKLLILVCLLRVLSYCRVLVFYFYVSRYMPI